MSKGSLRAIVVGLYIRYILKGQPRIIPATVPHILALVSVFAFEVLALYLLALLTSGRLEIFQAISRIYGTCWRLTSPAEPDSSLHGQRRRRASSGLRVITCSDMFNGPI